MLILLGIVIMAALLFALFCYLRTRRSKRDKEAAEREQFYNTYAHSTYSPSQVRGVIVMDNTSPHIDCRLATRRPSCTLATRPVSSRLCIRHTVCIDTATYISPFCPRVYIQPSPSIRMNV